MYIAMLQQAGKKLDGVKSCTIKQLKEVCQTGALLKCFTGVLSSNTLSQGYKVCLPGLKLPMQACEKHTRHQEDIGSHQNVSLPTS